MDIHVYTFEDSNGDAVEAAQPIYDYTYAKGYARASRLLIIDNTFTFEDSEPADDFRERQCGEGACYATATVEDANSDTGWWCAEHEPKVLS